MAQALARVEKSDSKEERDAALISALEAEEQLAAEFFTNEIAEQQIEAFRRYYGMPYGDEVEGRSQVVSRETFETVEWSRCDFTAIFTSGKRIVECDAETEEDDEYCEDAADRLNYIFFKENPGRQLLRDFVFDGLLQKRGYLACFWREEELGRKQTAELNPMQALELLQRQDIRIDLEPEELERLEPDEETGLIKIPYREIEKPARIEIKCIAPEDMRVNARYSSLADMPSKGHDERVTLSELIKAFPEHAEAIRERAGQSSWSREKSLDERHLARFITEDTAGYLAKGSSDLTDEVILKQDFIRFDYDGDGYAELRAVKRLDRLILENEEVSEDPYASWTPNPIPHKWFGLSVHDEVADIERIKTVTTRSALDSMYLSVVQRAVVDATTINLADTLVHRQGAVIRNDGPVKDGYMPITVPDTSQSALLMAEYWDKINERRTGVQRRAQALDPDALHKTAKGERLLQNAASVRKREKAVNLAEGLEQLFGKMYRLLIEHAPEAEEGAQPGYEAQLGPKRRGMINPRSWRKTMRFQCDVGIGTGAVDEQLSYLMAIQADQMTAMSTLGPDNPMVTFRHVYNTFEEKLRVMGYRTADQFASEPPPDWKPPPQPSPEMAKVEAEKQAKQAELQMKQQADAAEAQREQAKMQAEAQLEMQKLEMEMQLKREQIAAELQLKREQMMAEMQLKREMAAVDAEVKRTLAAKGVPPSGGGRPNGSGATSKVNVGGDPG